MKQLTRLIEAVEGELAACRRAPRKRTYAWVPSPREKVPALTDELDKLVERRALLVSQRDGAGAKESPQG
jgi:hypothetical protein